MLSHELRKCVYLQIEYLCPEKLRLSLGRRCLVSVKRLGFVSTRRAKHQMKDMIVIVRFYGNPKIESSSESFSVNVLIVFTCSGCFFLFLYILWILVIITKPNQVKEWSWPQRAQTSQGQLLYAVSSNVSERETEFVDLPSVFESASKCITSSADIIRHIYIYFFNHINLFSHVGVVAYSIILQTLC